MRNEVRRLSLLLSFLLLVGMFCGCSAETAAAGSNPEPTQAPEAEQELVVSQEASPEEIERQERLAAEKDGFLLDKGYLYAVDETGELLCDTWIGVLYFGEDGRYTSGSMDLDRYVAGVIRKNTDDSMTRMEMLRTVYEYTRDNIKYVGFGNHDFSYEPAHGVDGWMIESAIYALENGSGNCYHFAATFAALARGLGFQAYAASGEVGSEQQPHGWVEILDESGKVWYCDPETEYSRLYWLKEEFDLFYKLKEDIGSSTGLSYSSQIDPMEAERKEAEERESGIRPEA